MISITEAAADLIDVDSGCWLFEWWKCWEYRPWLH